MLKLAFVKPNYENEKRVAILPNDIRQNLKHCVFDSIIIESGFGSHMGIIDEEYEEVGCQIEKRETCFENDHIFSLKLIQPIDYPLLRIGSKIIGWMHPNGSGKYFYEKVAREKNISIFDIDSVYPRIYRPDGSYSDAVGLPPHFFWENSYIAGRAAAMIGIEKLGDRFSTIKNVCILGTGSVAQGSFNYLSSIGLKPRMFNRKTLNLFYDNIDTFDLIVNGIEMDVDGFHILSLNDLKKTKSDVMIIDAAADAGRAIEGTSYQSLASPIGIVADRSYVMVNNAPTILYNEASRFISKIIAKYVISKYQF